MKRGLAQFDQLRPHELDCSIECSWDKIEIVLSLAFVVLLQREVLDESKQSWQLMRTGLD